MRIKLAHLPASPDNFLLEIEVALALQRENRTELYVVALGKYISIPDPANPLKSIDALASFNAFDCSVYDDTPPSHGMATAQVFANTPPCSQSRLTYRPASCSALTHSQSVRSLMTKVMSLQMLRADPKNLDAVRDAIKKRFAAVCHL